MAREMDVERGAKAWIISSRANSSLSISARARAAPPSTPRDTHSHLSYREDLGANARPYVIISRWNGAGERERERMHHSEMMIGALL